MALMAAFTFTLIWSLIIPSYSVVNIASNNEAWYCNTNPLHLHPISPLSEQDVTRIKKLKQVHVMTRHGSRTHYENIQTYFPNSTQYYHCNISTLTSRIQYNDNDPNNKQYFVSMLKTYEYNSQYLLHSNCQRMQSYSTLIQQHSQNAQILINAYMDSDSPSQLFDISQINQNNLKIYTSDKERCMMSTMVLISHLLNISASNNSNQFIETITNDIETNPYSTNVLCNANEQFTQWKNKYINDISENFIQNKHSQILSQYSDVLSTYTDNGGLILNSSVYRYDNVGFQMTFYYCNGFDIPLENDTFWKLVDFGYKRLLLIHPKMNSSDGNEKVYAQKKQCYNHFLAIPMYKRYFDDISLMVNGDDNYKPFILHSAHDSSISLFLYGLGLHNGVIPYFAQMVTLEIYSADKNDKYNLENNIEYLFRFTNKGEFVAYEHCMNEYSVTDGELCDLNILLNNGFKDVNVKQRDWAEQRCKTLLDDCVCGYCNDEETEVKEHWMFEGISFLIGLLSGFVLLGLLLIIVAFVKRKVNAPQQNYTQTLDGSDIEMEEHKRITK